MVFSCCIRTSGTAHPRYSSCLSDYGYCIILFCGVLWLNSTCHIEKIVSLPACHTMCQVLGCSIVYTPSCVLASRGTAPLHESVNSVMCFVTNHLL
jgi:hypothetical protein